MIARRKGGILNIASTAAFRPGPMIAVYSASKAFVLSFSEVLHEEVKANGVAVAALCPGPTHTAFAESFCEKLAVLDRILTARISPCLMRP
jgi:short-subunit dehydrogenase